MNSKMWIQTFTGKAFNLSAPRASMVEIEDIAHALSTINRYTGHARWPYSVAQHSLMVAEIVAATSPGLGLAALLHDAEEAYIGDWSSPLKALVVERSNLQGYSSIPALVDRAVGCAIHGRFGVRLTPEDRRLIKHADLVALATEKRDLFGPPPQEGWGDATGFVLPEPLPARCQEVGWLDAKARFLEAFRSYGGVA